MRSQEDLKQLLAQDPENFSVLHDMASLFHQERNYSACFAMVERAIASYDNSPIPELQSHYFDIKRLHAHLLKDRLPEILGSAYYLIDQRWMPVFKFGRPREMALNITPSNISYLIPALNSPQLKKLRFLSISFDCASTDALTLLENCPLNMLRGLSMQYSDTPNFNVFSQFFSVHKEVFKDLISLSLRMPRINNDMLITARNALTTPEVLSFTSMDRNLITKEICEMLADDPRSNSLTRLSLVGTSIGNEGLFAIFSSDNFNALQALDVHDGYLTNGAAKVIAAAHSLPNLHSIDVRFNTIDPAGIDILQRLPIKVLTDGQHMRPAGR